MEALDPNNYLLTQEGIDWQQCLSTWQHRLPNTFTIWIVNRFGDLFMIYEDGSLHHLDVQLGTITKRADTKAEFLNKLTEENNATDWLYMDYVDLANTAELKLKPGECYTFKLPPVLSGEYTRENLCTTQLDKNYAFLADVHQQIKDLPEDSTLQLATPEEA